MTDLISHGRFDSDGSVRLPLAAPDETDNIAVGFADAEPMEFATGDGRMSPIQVDRLAAREKDA